MAVSGDELRRAREAAEDLLEEMGLAAYLYELEPAEEGWLVRVECAVSDGWQSAELPVAREQLLAVGEDSRVRADLLTDWGGELAACRRLPED
ncbi:MAG TPA: hypothetical protein VKA55_06445 [Gammaproteobacteria bacterium]|nr:hypothetical protein [Gammaproteobacteria bacterium]